MSAHVCACLHINIICPHGGVFQDFVLVFCINKLNLNKDFKIEEMKSNVCFLQAYFIDTNRLIQELVHSSCISNTKNIKDNI